VPHTSFNRALKQLQGRKQICRDSNGKWHLLVWAQLTLVHTANPVGRPKESSPTEGPVRSTPL
jgi:hypothetical protein